MGNPDWETFVRPDRKRSIRITDRWESGSTCCLHAVNSIEERTPKTVVESDYQQNAETDNRTGR